MLDRDSHSESRLRTDSKWAPMAPHSKIPYNRTNQARRHENSRAGTQNISLEKPLNSFIIPPKILKCMVYILYII